MRVLFNTYPVAFDCPGGGEVQLHECRLALERLGVEVLLFDPWNPQFDEVDLVHYFSVQGGSMNFCDYVKRLGLPLLISPVLWLTQQNVHQYPLGEIRDLLHLCDRILPNSESECEQLAEAFHLDREKFSAIPNGVDASFCELGEAEPFCRHFGVNGPFLLNVANIEPRKNQEVLADVASSLDLDLLLLGRPRSQEYLQNVLGFGSPRVRHLGTLDHNDPLLKSAYRACRVFVLPSLLETPGLAALEAAAQGAKLVITAVGSTQDYFGSDAIYVDPHDARALRRAIVDAWNAPESDTLRQRVLQNYTWDHAGRALVDAYQRTLLLASSVR